MVAGNEREVYGPWYKIRLATMPGSDPWMDSGILNWRKKLPGER